MSLAQRLAWFEALSTSAIVIAMLALPQPAGGDPTALLGLVARVCLVVAVCSTTFYFKPFGEGIQVAMIGAAAALVGTAMLVALVLDYPYSGGVAVSSAPFKESALFLLAGG